MKKWEYKFLEVNLAKNSPTEVEEILNDYGENGWEVISNGLYDLNGILGGVETSFTLKREKE